jgi:very-short-patch-repair endonuclease
MDELKIIRAYESGKSVPEIAEEFSTYPMRVYRILKKNNVSMRDRAECQSLAISKGRAKHPTKGKPMSESSKEALSESRSLAWQTMSKSKKEAFKEKAKERWDSLSENHKAEMQKKAAEALRKAAIEGSDIEKYIRKMLISKGYNVTIHRDNLGGEFEVDIFLKDQKIAIEIDGPLHFLPIFGEEKLQKTIKQDTIKNGLLLSKGIHVVRIKCVNKNFSNKAKRDIWLSLEKVLQDIESGKLSGLIEV